MVAHHGTLGELYAVVAPTTKTASSELYELPVGFPQGQTELLTLVRKKWGWYFESCSFRQVLFFVLREVLHGPIWIDLSLSVYPCSWIATDRRRCGTMSCKSWHKLSRYWLCVQQMHYFCENALLQHLCAKTIFQHLCANAIFMCSKCNIGEKESGIEAQVGCTTAAGCHARKIMNVELAMRKILPARVSEALQLSLTIWFSNLQKKKGSSLGTHCTSKLYSV